MTYIIYGIGFLISIIALILLTGAMLPIKHVASKTIIINANNAQVWQLITSYRDMPTWRNDVTKIDIMTDDNGVEIVYEYENDIDFLAFETIERIEGKKLVRKIYGERLPFGGTWTFELLQNSDTTELTIVEHGEVYNILFRFVSRFIIGHHATINKYIDNIATVFK